jgi:phage terminase small subunit
MTRGRTNETDQRKQFAGKPRPPHQLTPTERAIWTKVCAKQTAEWCELAASGAVLEMYCVAVARYRLIHATCNALVAAPPDGEGDAVVLLAGRLDQSGKLFNQLGLLEQRIAALETKLRLTPQSRIRSDRANNEPPSPWGPMPGGGPTPEDDGDTA